MPNGIAMESHVVSSVPTYRCARYMSGVAAYQLVGLRSVTLVANVVLSVSSMACCLSYTSLPSGSVMRRRSHPSPWAALVLRIWVLTCRSAYHLPRREYTWLVLTRVSHASRCMRSARMTHVSCVMPAPWYTVLSVGLLATRMARWLSL